MDHITQHLQSLSNSSDTIEVVASEQTTCVKKTFVRDVGRAKANVGKQRRFQSCSAAGFKVSAAEMLQSGHLVELVPEAHCDSMRRKTGRHAQWGHLPAYRFGSVLVQQVRAVQASVQRLVRR